MIDYNLLGMNYIGDLNTPFDKMLCDIIDKYRDGTYEHVTLYIWVEYGVTKLCLTFRLHDGRSPYEIGVSTCQGTVSGLEIHDVSHIVTSDNSIGFYDDTCLLAYSNGDLELRADITTEDGKYIYRKLEDEMDD